MADTTEATTTLDKLGQVIVKASFEPSFRSDLLKSPASMLKSNGIDIPTGTQVQVQSNTDTVRYIVLPATSVTISTEEEQELTSLASSSGASSQQEAEVTIVVKALNDGSLRSQLISDPKSVLEKAGAPIPSGITIKVLEATSTLNYLVIAPAVTLSDAQKEEAEEEAAAEAEAHGLTNLAKFITAGSYAAGLGFAAAATFKPKGPHADMGTTAIDTPTALEIGAAALLFIPATVPTKT
jgi:hypothetical protein